MNLKDYRPHLLLICLMVFATMFVGCQNSSSANRRSGRNEDYTRNRTTTTATIESTEPLIATDNITSSTIETLDSDGERMEFDYFSIVIADGYNTLDLMGGTQIYRGFDAVEVWVRPTSQSEDEALTDASQLSGLYDGTEPVSASYFGYIFYTTRLNFAGMDQTIMTCITDGYKIQITIAGSDHENNADLISMFESIVFHI